MKSARPSSSTSIVQRAALALALLSTVILSSCSLDTLTKGSELPPSGFTTISGVPYLVVPQCGNSLSAVKLGIVWAIGGPDATPQTSTVPSQEVNADATKTPDGSELDLYNLSGVAGLLATAQESAPAPYTYGLFKVSYEMGRVRSGSTTVPVGPIPEYPEVTASSLGRPSITTASELAKCEVTE